MRLIDQSDDSFTVQLSRDELRTLSQALNEVRNGPDSIETWEFATRMGVTPEEADAPAGSIRAALR